MHNRFLALAPTLLTAALTLAACASEKKAETAPKLQPVSGWDGVQNVTQAGRFTFAGQPTEASLERFARAGGAMVIDMRTHQGADTPSFDERSRVESLGMTYINLPFTPAGFSREDVAKFTQSTKKTRGPILLHCGSSNRVGGLWAAYLAIEEGVPTEEAIAEGKAAGMRSPEVEAAARRVIGR